MLIKSLNPALTVTWSKAHWSGNVCLCCITTHSALVVGDAIRHLFYKPLSGVSKYWHLIPLGVGWLTARLSILQTLPKSLLSQLIQRQTKLRRAKQDQWGGAAAGVITPWLWIIPSLASRPQLCLQSHDEMDNGLLSQNLKIDILELQNGIMF